MPSVGSRRPQTRISSFGYDLVPWALGLQSRLSGRLCRERFVRTVLTIIPQEIPTKDLVPFNREKKKPLQVILSNEEYELFKQYAEATEMGGPRKRAMSELAADWIRVQLWRQTECCSFADELVNDVMVKDPRQEKLCWGFKCSYCTIQEGCMAGTDPRSYLPTDIAIQHMKPAAKAEALTLKGDEFLREVQG